MSEVTDQTWVPTPREFFLEVPLYETFLFDEEKDVKALHAIKYFYQQTMDSYCPWCARESVFDNVNSSVSWDDYESTREQIYSVSLKCSRNSEHRLFFVVKIKNSEIQKIGQFPSLADLQLQELKRYAGILGGDRYRELVKAVGLAAHGVGVGSFVYLRRIFEGLVEEARQAASNTADWDNESYQRSRMSEKIAMLRGFLPEFLVEHPKLYGIMSKGIHELSENECLKHFPVVKVGIEIILDEQLETLRRQEKLAAASKAIREAGVS